MILPMAVPGGFRRLSLAPHASAPALSFIDSSRPAENRGAQTRAAVVATADLGLASMHLPRRSGASVSNPGISCDQRVPCDARGAGIWGVKALLRRCVLRRLRIPVERAVCRLVSSARELHHVRVLGGEMGVCRRPVSTR